MKYNYIKKLQNDVKIIIILIKYQKKNFGLLEYDAVYVGWFPSLWRVPVPSSTSANTHRIWELQISILYNCPHTEDGVSMSHESVGAHLPNRSVLHSTEHSNMSDVMPHNTIWCPQPSNKASNPTTLTPATKHLLSRQQAQTHTSQLSRVLNSLSQYAYATRYAATTPCLQKRT